MKFILSFMLFSTLTNAQNLSPEEQKKLIEENKFLREEVIKAKTAPVADSKMMETLQKGQKYQEEQLKALEELDKED